jgi:hypothetical protein
MSGSGGGSGYNFQARAIAYVGAHILAQRRLDWIDHSIPDIPVAVATETGGPGDDIQVTLQDGVKLEIQAKKGLRYNQKFWDALLRLASGLTKEPSLHGVLLIDPKATGKIKNELREDFRTLGVNGSGNLKQITQEVIARFRQEGIQVTSELFRRFKIIQADFQDSSPEVKFASELLSQVVHDGNQAKNAWKVLDSDGHQLIELKGKRDIVALARLLTNVPIQLAETADNPIIVAEVYREWLNRTTAYFTVLGFGTELSVESAWIQLQASNHKKIDEAFNADYIPHAYHRVVVTGKSGAGKSTFLQRIAHRLSNSDKRFLWIRLPRVAKYFEQGKPFAEAILIDAAENSGLEISQLKRVLANPDYLLADGLDECDVSQLGSIAQQLVSWSDGHSDTKIIVTTRPDNHNAASFPEWEHVTLLPLASQDIKKNTRQLLEARFNDESQVEKQLALFEQKIQFNRTASLAAQNPLLLGFLVQLSINDIELAQNRAGLYESIIELSHKQSSLNRKFNVEIEPPIAFRIIEITGWILQNSPVISERKLVEELGKELADELDCKLLAAQGEAQKGLDFWKERRIVECLQMGHQNVVTFVHLSLQEYVAGKYAASLTHQKLCEWLAQVRQDPKWKEVILFAAGAGAAERISMGLLQLDRLEKTGLEVWLAAEALAEISNPSLECVEKIVNRLRLLLESSTPDEAFRAAEAILPFTVRAADFIGSIVQPLCKHSQPWTCIAAMRVALDCGEDYVDLSILRKVFDNISAEIIAVKMASVDSFVTLNPETGIKIINLDLMLDEYIEKLDIPLLYEEFLLRGSQILVKQQPTFELIKQISQVTQIEFLRGGTRVLLFNLVQTYLEGLHREERLERTKQLNLYDGFKLYKPDISPQGILNTKRDIERCIDGLDGTQALLKAIFRATGSTVEAPLQRPPEGLINLGILITGMGWWHVSNRAWIVLIKRDALEAVDVVFRGAIAVMSVEPQRLATETAWALEDLKRIPSYNLNSIAVSSRTHESSENNTQELEGLLQISSEMNKAYSSFHEQIPKIPADPKWELAREAALSPEALVRALKHPSEGIRLNAAQLLSHGAGGDEAADLVQKFLEDV